LRKNIPTFEFHFEELRDSAAKGDTLIFPEKYEADKWVQYHGTSSAFERSIDCEGLKWKPAIASRKDIEDVVRVFGSMNWRGKSGYRSDLTVYSLGRHCAENENGVYFSETPWRCLGYARRVSAGGETVCAIRGCIKELQTYLNRKSVRDDHMEFQVDQLRKNFDARYPRERVIEVDLGWLRNQLAALKSLKERCRKPYVSHRHAVIYAVKFAPDDFEYFDPHGGSGESFLGALDPGRLCAKARVFGDFDEPSIPMAASAECDVQRCDSSSFLYQLSKYQKSRDQSGQSGKEFYDWGGVELDPTAGRDISAEIEIV